jgi:hypothetical protein
MQLSSALRRTAWVAAAAGASLMGLGGCASNKATNGTQADGQTDAALVSGSPGEAGAAAENSESPKVASGSKTPSGAEQASALDPTILGDDILKRVNPENISVNVVQHVPSAEEAQRSFTLSKAQITKAAEEYAALGQYLKEHAPRAPENQRISIAAMSDFSFAVSHRISLLGTSAGEIQIALDLASSASNEMDDWALRTKEPQARSRLARSGAETIAQIASASGAPVSEIEAELKSAWTKTALLIIATREYGAPMWGDAVTESRRKAAAQIATVIEHDQSIAKLGQPLDPAVVNANLRVAATAEKLMQVVLVAGDSDVVKKLRLLSPQGGSEIVGASVLDTDAFARFSAFAKLNPLDESSMLRWALLRNVPKVSERFFSGSQVPPAATASPEVASGLQSLLKDEGLAE